MTKITLTDLSNLQNETTAVNAINANSAVLVTAFDNTLSRDGTSPNVMASDLDMNSFQILNLPFPTDPTSPLRLQDYANKTAVPLGGTAGQVLTKVSSTDFDTDWTTIVGLTSSSSTTLVGNLASYSNTAGSFISATPSFQLTNPGSSALYTNIAYPVGRVAPSNGMQISVGPAIDGGLQFGGGVGTPQAIVGTVDIAAGDLTSYQGSGVAGYAITHQPIGGLGAVAVGVFGQASMSVSNCSTFGGNFVASNYNGSTTTVGFDANYITACEFDVNLWKRADTSDPVITNGHVYGTVVAGSSNLNATIVGSSGYVLDRLSVNTNVPWYYGFSTYDNAATIGLFLGSAGIGNNINSQPIRMKGRTSGGSERTVDIHGDTNGALILSPDSNSGITAILNGIGGTTLLNVSSAFGNAHLNVPSLTTAGVLTNDTSGNFISTTTPNLGTPSAVVLTNATGTAAGLTVGNATTATTASAVAVGGITGLGTGMATFLATPSSANLITAVTDETGTGSLVFATSPTLVTPTIGVATATSINKMAITAPATSSTLAVANSKTFTVNNTLTLAGTDSTTITFQGTDTYVGRATTDTLTNKTFDTAGAGNSFSINGVAATANTGTGSVVRATSPTLVTPVLGVATATTINGVTLDNLAWTTYTPNVTAEVGTPTTVTATGRYKQIGKTIIVEADVTITTIGTATSGIKVDLPFTAAAFRYVGSAFEYGLTAKSGAAFVNTSGTFLVTKDATGTTFWAPGNKVAITVIYEIP